MLQSKLLLFGNKKRQVCLKMIWICAKKKTASAQWLFRMLSNVALPISNALPGVQVR